MAILRRRFHHHERGNHDETWHFLARDTETDRVFVIRGWAARADVGEEEIELADFLADVNSSAKAKLRDLIGSLVGKPNA